MVKREGYVAGEVVGAERLSGYHHELSILAKSGGIVRVPVFSVGHPSNLVQLVHNERLEIESLESRGLLGLGKGLTQILRYPGMHIMVQQIAVRQARELSRNYEALFNPGDYIIERPSEGILVPAA